MNTFIILGLGYAVLLLIMLLFLRGLPKDDQDEHESGEGVDGIRRK